jgi:PAS domain S-box-containing protein
MNNIAFKQLELETLLEITNTLIEHEHVDDLLQDILIRTCGILDASCGFILIEKKNSDLFIPKAVFNLDEKVLSKIIFNKKRGFLNVLATQQEKFACNAIENIHLEKLEKSFALAAPIMGKNQLLGSIIIFDKELRNGKSDFSAEDAAMLSAISVQASVAYNNTFLLDTLLESKRFNDNIMESIHTGVITTNLFGEIDYVNKTAEKIAHISTDECIGNHYQIMFEKDPDLIVLLEKVEQEVSVYSEQNFLIKIGQESVHVNLTVSPLIDDQGEQIGMVIAMEDISYLDKIKSTFKKYVSKQIVDKILENEDLLNLGGQELTLTTIFTDIRGFTNMSEKMDPIDVVRTLNDYFDLMIDVVFKYNGTLDKIIGDALMVIYGAPIYGHDDTQRALLTAIEMQKLLIDFNAGRIEKGMDPIEIGIGINRGKAIAGNIGSKDQMNYTVIGDAVNLASRLCSNADAGQILVSESVVAEVEHSGLFDFQKLEAIKVKGKAQEVQIYALSTCFATPKVLEVYDLVINRLLINLSPDLFYHAISHTLDVFTSARKIAISEGVGEDDLELLLVAALFHDTGFLVQADGHEEISCQMATDHLIPIGFSKAEMEIICGMIWATKIPQKPQNLLEEILADADLDYLGRADFFTIGSQLFNELKVRNVVNEESAWDQIQIKFLENHHYFTNTARNLRAEQKEKHLQIIKSKYS